MPKIYTIPLSSSHYPRRLLDLRDPPHEIYCMGKIEALSKPGFAIVGARKASLQGQILGAYFGKILANEGFCIVSGLAKGVDSAAHKGALTSKQEISTIAVCGTSLDKYYPACNEMLQKNIAENSLLISEYPPHTRIQAFHFAKRNRLIAALSQGVLVIEASLKSGSLITAKQALDLGREVFAIPQEITPGNPSGCNYLIKEGAKLTETAADILDELGHTNI